MKQDQAIRELEISLMDKKNALAMDLFRQAIKLKKETSFTDPTMATDEDALGILISQFSKWDGQKIFHTAFQAFEDSNFHSFNQKFRNQWNKEGK